MDTRNGFDLRKFEYRLSVISDWTVTIDCDRYWTQLTVTLLFTRLSEHPFCSGS